MLALKAQYVYVLFTLCFPYAIVLSVYKLLNNNSKYVGSVSEALELFLKLTTIKALMETLGPF